jgi:N-acetyl-1-D-myo-inositol-2-amino-2-deoxy-alpha-D-glucopyranoside deacetylase
MVQIAKLPLQGRRLLAVFAHPDDESLASGGTLARAAAEGAYVAVLCATRGEAGCISQSVDVAPGTLGNVRVRELRDAANILGIAEVVILDHPDGHLPWEDEALLQAEILVAIRHFRPDVVITFGEDGLYWHPDHIAIHERTTAAVASLGGRAPALYYVTMPRGAMRGVVEAVRDRSIDPAVATVFGIDADAFGEGASAPTLTVDVREYAGRKLAALRCHRTQVGPENPLALLPGEVAADLLGIEQYRLAPLAHTSPSFLDELAAGQTA